MKKKKYSTHLGDGLGEGISDVAKSEDKYYILEHLVGSYYHESGEKQEIKLDEVLLGRGEDCQVRFDESFETVSRHHASIVRDGDNWRLVQLSQTNTTFLNGVPVQESWLLQSGDEIQLSVNGPKLIFRVPTDKSGMSLTARLDSFRETTTRPYKKVIIIICSVVALLIIGGIISGIVIKHQHDHLEKQEKIIEQQENDLKKQKEAYNNLYQNYMETYELADSTTKAQMELKLQAIKDREQLLNEQYKQAKTIKEQQKIINQMQEEQAEVKRFLDSIANPSSAPNVEENF